MALPSSGAISLLAIANEFGGSAPHSLNEYYGVASGIPSSGQISMNQFYGASAVVTQSVKSFSSSAYTLYTAVIYFFEGAGTGSYYGITWSGSWKVTPSNASYNFFSYANPSDLSSLTTSLRSNTPFPAHSGTIGGWRYFGRRGQSGLAGGDEFGWLAVFTANRTTGSSYPF